MLVVRLSLITIAGYSVFGRLGHSNGQANIGPSIRLDFQRAFLLRGQSMEKIAKMLLGKVVSLLPSRRKAQLVNIALSHIGEVSYFRLAEHGIVLALEKRREQKLSST